MTSQVIHSDGRTTLVILEIFSWDIVIITYDSIRINVFFCIETGCLLRFVVSKDRIWIDPLKIATILALPTLTNLLELQILQGKENFLRSFVFNFAKETHGYTHLLKNDTPFFWDDQAQRAFDNLKHALTHSPVIHPQIIQRTFSCILLPLLLPLLWFWCRKIPTVRSTWFTMRVRILWILKPDIHAWRI